MNTGDTNLTKEQMQTRLKKDPFIKLWEDNFRENHFRGFLNREDARPLLFIKNMKPYINKPVVIIAAGPSLDKNIQILKEYQNNCIILCADVTLFKLIENGIKPDFVVNIDPHESLCRFWKNIDTSELALICPTTTNPKTIESWKGKIYFFNQSDVPGQSKGEALKKITSYTKGWGTLFNRFFVGATMFQFSEFLHPSVVILIGHDFSYTDNKAFCEGFLDLKIHHDEDREGSEEHARMVKKLKENELKKEISIKISATESVWTSGALNLYKNTLLTLIQESKLRVINATEGGILIEIERMSFSKALTIFCGDIIVKVDTFDVKRRKRKKRR